MPDSVRLLRPAVSDAMARCLGWVEGGRRGQWGPASGLGKVVRLERLVVDLFQGVGVAEK